MKAISIHNGSGPASALYIADNIPTPIPQNDHILVSIKAFGLNRMDIMQRENKYPYPLLPESGDIMGVEFSGVVLEDGPECTGTFKVGEKVFGLAYGGAYAEKISVSEKMLIHLPPNLTFEEAAGIPETFFTAIQAIHLVGNLQPGQKVLIHAAASGVGQSAIQVARLGGASTIFTTAGSDEKCTLCRDLGADVSINYRTTDFAEVISRETAGKGVDLIIDLVGKDYFHRNLASAGMDSKIVLVAALSGSDVDEFNLRSLLNKRIWLLATTLRTRDKEYQGRLRDVFVERVLPAIQDGEVRTVVDRVYGWGDVGEAHRRLESNVNAGKIICRVD